MTANVLFSTSALEPGPAQGLHPWWERKLTFEMCVAFIFSLNTLLRSVCFLSGTRIDILEEPEVNDTHVVPICGALTVQVGIGGYIGAMNGCKQTFL